MYHVCVQLTVSLPDNVDPHMVDQLVAAVGRLGGAVSEGPDAETRGESTPADQALDQTTPDQTTSDQTAITPGPDATASRTAPAGGTISGARANRPPALSVQIDLRHPGTPPGNRPGPRTKRG